MAEHSAIEWTDATFNPWIGCTRVSPACDHCYAERFSRRLGVAWGPKGERRRTSEANWRQPLAWDRKAAKAGIRKRVFCASLADVFDNQVPETWRADLWELIAATPHLDWLLLTKRPQNIAKMLPQCWAAGQLSPNVWLGTTVENQTEANRRIPHLLAVPAVKRFLSCEPLLGPVDLRRHLVGHEQAGIVGECVGWTPPLDWIIAGGESGPGARPAHPDWFRSLRDQCQAAGVPFFFKQWGEWGAIDPTRRAEARAIADDGTVYRMADLAYPNGARRGEAIRAGHTNLKSIYRVGKRAAGAMLDGCEHREIPG